MGKINSVTILSVVFVMCSYMVQSQEVDTLLIQEKPAQSSINHQVPGFYGQSLYDHDSISNKQLSTSNSGDATRMIQSQVAGLNISANSFTPGASSRITMRGFRSFGNRNQPLILLNGLPIDNSEWNNGTGGTDQSNRLLDIDPNSIESVDIIKSAVGRARYGIVGANGIISIHTKKGYKSKPRITLNSSIGKQQISNKIALQNTYAQGRLDNGQYIYRGPETLEGNSWGPKISDLVYDGDSNYPFDKNGRLISNQFDSGPNANAYDPYDFFQSGLQSNLSLQVAGGTDRLSYSAVASTNNQEGVIPTNQYNRYNLGTTIEYNVNRKLSLQLDASITKSSTARTQKGADVQGIMLGLLRTSPTFDNSNASDDPVNDTSSYQLSDGSQRSYRSGIYDNPYWSINKNKNRNDVSRYILGLSGKYELNDRLNVLFGIGQDQYTDNRSGGEDINANYNPGNAYERNLDFSSMNVDISANYKILNSKNLKLSSTLGFNYNQRKSTFTTTEGRALLSAGNVSVSNLQEIENYSSIFDVSRAGGFFILDIAYKNIVDVNGSLRQDYHNKSGRDVNGFLSYGVGAGLSITNLLLDNTQPRSYNVRVVGSVGKLGNETTHQNITGAYVAANIVGDGFISTSTFYGLELNNTNNDKDLTAETTDAFDIGIHLSHKKRDLQFSIMYYDEESSGLVQRESVAVSTGTEFQIKNSGSMSNKGVDISLSGMVLEKKNFSWNLGLDFNKNTNVVTSLGGQLEQVTLGGFVSQNSALIENQPYGVIYGNAFLRNDNNELIIDNEGYPIVDQVRQPIANPNPDWTMYIRNSITIGKNLRIAATVDIKQGGEMYCGTCGTLDYFGRTQLSADERGTSVVFNGVTENGAINTQPVDLASPNGSFNQFYRVRYGFGGITEMSIYDAGWVRLRHISIQYNLKSLIKLKAINELTLGLYGENLVVLSDYPSIDPETNLTGNAGGIGIDYYNNPGVRTYGVSLNASF